MNKNLANLAAIARIAEMIRRRSETELIDRLASQAAVVILGPRQVGKTTLALEVAAKRPSVYLDLESAADRARIIDAPAYFERHRDELVILDEIHRAPGIFEELRGIIDRGRRSGHGTGRFLLLGSASMDVMRQSGESLAGRASYMELDPFDLNESAGPIDELWLRGGFPGSLLASSPRQSMAWRRDFIKTYLERDIPQFGGRIPAETLRRFWTMLAHLQATPLNSAKIAASLGVAGSTAGRYLDLMVDLLLVRRLSPWSGNVGKRLVKAPKVYIRDPGLVHSLLAIETMDDLLSHPVCGASWEGLLVENLVNLAGDEVEASYYRTSTGNEIDLILEWPGGTRWAIEIKRSTAPRIGKGFRFAQDDLNPRNSFLVYPGMERFPLAKDVEAIGPSELAAEVRSMSSA